MWTKEVCRMCWKRGRRGEVLIHKESKAEMGGEEEEGGYGVQKENRVEGGVKKKR